MELFWQYINSYTVISDPAREAWQQLLQKKTIPKNKYFLMEGSIPKRVAFLTKGLFSYYYTDKDGARVIKKFFPEHTLVASTTAMLLQRPSMFTIQALEDTDIISYSFEGFRKLSLQYSDIAGFYIRYMEQHWIIEKEIGEITLKYQTARQRYLDFIKNNPALFDRLKQHHMASYLGITPTQLSRIRAEL